MNVLVVTRASKGKVMHVDVQQIIALSIVAFAAAVVGRRMIGQVAAFWTKDKDSHCGGCEGCGPSKSTETKAPQLVQLQMTAPKRIKRPTNDA